MRAVGGCGVLKECSFLAVEGGNLEGRGNPGTGHRSRNRSQVRRGGCEVREYLCELGKLKGGGGCGCSGEVWVFVVCPTQTNETVDWATKSGT